MVSMDNKVRWQREQNGTAVPYMYENNKWVRYNQSRAYVPDFQYSSKGYASFVNALKLKYETEPLKENY